MSRDFEQGRRVERLRINSPAFLRNGTGIRIHANLFNVSQFGCAIYVPRAHLTVERIYSLRTAGVELLTVKVAWVRDPYAGLEFVDPLHPSVAENLARMFPVTNEDPEFCDGDLLVEIVRHNARATRRPFDPPLTG